MTTEKKHALYLVKDGENGGTPRLFAAEDVDAAKANGWSEPDFPKSNGEPWNAEEELDAQDAAAELAKAKRDADEKAAAKDAKAGSKKK